MKSPPFDFDCPVCGERVRVNAKACPCCGACDRSGWGGAVATDGLDLPDEDFDYEQFVAEEFGTSRSRSNTQWLWWTAALLLLAVLAIALLNG